MRENDASCVRQQADPQSRHQAIRRWRRSRTYTLAAFGLIYVAAVISALGGNAAACGLSSGAAAAVLAIAVSLDMRIKVALLAEELKTK